MEERRVRVQSLAQYSNRRSLAANGVLKPLRAPLDIVTSDALPVLVNRNANMSAFHSEIVATPRYALETSASRLTPRMDKVILRRPDGTTRNQHSLMNPSLTLDEGERYYFEKEVTAQKMVPLLQIRHLSTRKQPKKKSVYQPGLPMI